MSEQSETLTIADLDRVYIRVQKDDSAEFESVNCRDASDLQFDAWARSCMVMSGDDHSWSMEERAEFCDLLHRAAGLILLKKDMDFSEKEAFMQEWLAQQDRKGE